MTEPDLTPAQNEAVRRLLAEARHDQPMPPEVVARFDGVLDDLRAGPGESGPHVADDTGGSEDGASSAPVTPLRKRSRIPQLLLAAAAVVAVGFGVTQVLPTGDDGAGSGEDSQADSSVAEVAPEEGNSALREQPGADAGSPNRLDRKDASSYLASERGKRLVDRIPLAGLQSTKADLNTQRYKIAAGRCGPDTIDPGQRRAPATYEGEPAVVVFHAPGNGKRQADIYLCDPSLDQELLRSVTLPAR